MIKSFLIIISIIGISKMFFTEPNYIKKIEVQDSIFGKGQNIFKRDCAACHYIGMDKIATAPALGGITKRRKKDWLYNYTKNSYKMFEEGDSIAEKLRDEGWGLMTSFPKLSNSDLDAIYYFVEKRCEMSKKYTPTKK